ncbi:MAG: tRNA (guanosine(37)-N1)-methyltransferase TrmD [Clostridia bacterium]|nr:tRNA (guanosine(37)-N1)-methyltransferase TrmD [Clostridia bacterium]
MKFTVITLFPNIISEYVNTSIISKAIKQKIIEIDIVDLRAFGKGKRRNVDDTVYGGGSGMVITVPVLDEALNSIEISENAKIIYLSPKGKTLNQNITKQLSKECTDLILICGHYEGIDERIFDLYPIEEISIGDFVLTGGELAALALIDSVTRLIPGTIKEQSWSLESFEQDLLEEAQYTKPEEYKSLKVPSVLLSGHHENIEKYRLEDRIYTTYKKRPDLLKKYISKNKIKENYIKEIVAKKEGNQNGYN